MHTAHLCRSLQQLRLLPALQEPPLLPRQPLQLAMEQVQLPRCARFYLHRGIFQGRLMHSRCKAHSSLS